MKRFLIPSAAVLACSAFVLTAPTDWAIFGLAALIVLALVIAFALGWSAAEVEHAYQPTEDAPTFTTVQEILDRENTDA